MGTQQHTNRLIHETSPYLLQHAHNPVDWYPWGEAALRRAREEARPIFLSIGYSSCHWCHVMERESFESPEIAALMNEHFVCIKVDREERPDIDEIYMTATQVLNQGRGGWPMTVFLTPDQKPFFAGTYFPPQDRYGSPGLDTLLVSIAEHWRRNREGMEARAGELSALMRKQAMAASSAASSAESSQAVCVTEIETAAANLAARFDSEHGGFGPAPKFPSTTSLSLLLRHHRRFRDPDALEMVRVTLDGMARGGINDHVCGGFARYSTDERWLVPHFEKMLYDNALLARAYTEASQAFDDSDYRRVATEILDYVLRDMTAPEGGFYSATDADSEGEEGKFYVWTPREIETILGARQARQFCAYYDITEAGNWEGKSIPNTPRSLDDVATALRVAPAELEVSLREGRNRVREARARRPQPALDDKIITAWNGLMIGALAEGYRVLGARRYLDAAVAAADFLLSRLIRPDGGLFRTFRCQRAHLDAYLEDYAYLSDALIDLYEAGGGPRFLRQAMRMAERLRADFADERGGGFYSTARDHELLLFRFRDGKDSATPSGNAVAARALARLSFHFDRSDLRGAAAEAIEAYGMEIAEYPVMFAGSLAVTDLLVERPIEIAFIGRAGSEELRALQAVVARQYLPNRIIACHDPGASGDDSFPLLAGKACADGKATLYLCRNFTCEAPITDPAKVAEYVSKWARPS